MAYDAREVRATAHAISFLEIVSSRDSIRQLRGLSGSDREHISSGAAIESGIEVFTHPPSIVGDVPDPVFQSVMYPLVNPPNAKVVPDAIAV